MTVLIVDDQISVVSGLVFGINWKRLGDCRVLKAYNAFEAREQLKKHKVDILLCDIEMPVESGLSLYKWIKEEKMDIECIFLTAHADFIYAKEAIRLESIDYILQPARYEDIENSILRTMDKINSNRRIQRIKSIGELVIEQKDLILNGILKDWFLGQEESFHKVKRNLEGMGINFLEDAKCFLIYTQVFQNQEALNNWSEELIKYAMKNIVTELFSYYGQEVLLYQLNKEEYIIYLYHTEPENHIEKEVVIKQLEHFVDVFYEYYNSNLACYVTECKNLNQVRADVDKLIQLKSKHVVISRTVFDADAGNLGDGENKLTLTDFCPDLDTLLENNMYDTICDNAMGALNEVMKSRQLSADSLLRFYQEFMRVVYLAAEKNNSTPSQIFENQDDLKRALTAYSSIDDMVWLIRYVNGYFSEFYSTEEKQKTQIDQILIYIRSNIDENIKRTDIADAVHLNPNYVSRLFKKEVGVSLKEYIVTEKMKLAKQMVRTTKMSISMIAMKVGYTNFSHFTQVYKKMFNGITPAEDREAYLNTK